MTKQNCWEFTKCGREPKGKKAHEFGICPAAIFDESDGYCGGKNGGRACMYIAGTFCPGVISGTNKEALKDCGKCDFYWMLKQEHGSEMSVFSFYKHVKERKKDFPGTTEHEIHKLSALPRKENHTGADSPFQKDWLKDPWLRLLGLADYCNRAIKHGEWYQEDIKQFYELKDAVMEKIYRNPPQGAARSLRKVSYSQDSEEQEKSLIEMEVTYEGRIFCFHIPIEKVKNWGLNMIALSSKKWIPSSEFNRQSFKEVFEEIQKLLGLV